MKTVLTLAPLAAGLLFGFDASAQDHSQHQLPAMQEHSQHRSKPDSKPKPESSSDANADSSTLSVPKAPAAMDHAMPSPDSPAMEHDSMNHGAPRTVPMDHAAMDHTMSPSADQPVTPIPVLTDADRAAAMPPPNDHPVHDNTPRSFVRFDRLEGFDTNEGAGLEWAGQAWIGTDLNKLWLRSEGERVGRHTESADLEVLYGRAVARWWDVVAGVRHDFKPGASQDFAAIGIKGLAPYKFEVEATAYIGQSGQTAARLEAEYETLLTNRLILQSLIEVNAYGRDDPRRGIESGLSTVEAGVRLRYEFTRQFAPYIGLVREHAFGGTADLREAEGEDVSDTRFVAGVRVWF